MKLRLLFRICHALSQNISRQSWTLTRSMSSFLLVNSSNVVVIARCTLSLRYFLPGKASADISFHGEMFDRSTTMNYVLALLIEFKQLRSRHAGTTAPLSSICSQEVLLLHLGATVFSRTFLSQWTSYGSECLRHLSSTLTEQMKLRRCFPSVYRSVHVTLSVLSLVTERVSPET